MSRKTKAAQDAQRERISAHTFVALLEVGAMIFPIGFHISLPSGALLARDTDAALESALAASLRSGAVLVTTPHRVESRLANGRRLDARFMAKNAKSLAVWLAKDVRGTAESRTRAIAQTR